MPISTLLANIFLLILFILPGVLSIRVAEFVSKQPNKLSRIDTIVYSICISLTAFLLLYYLSSLSAYGVRGGLPASALTPSSWITPDDLLSIPPRELIPLSVHGYISTISLAIIFGMYYGTIKFRVIGADFDSSDLVPGKMYSNAWTAMLRSDPKRTRKTVWDYIFKNIYTNSQVEVVKTDGNSLTGEIILHGDSVQNRDLLLAGTESSEQGYIYVPPGEVSYILIKEEINETDAVLAAKMSGNGYDSQRDPAIENEIDRRDEVENIDDLYDIYEVEDREELVDAIINENNKSD